MAFNPSVLHELELAGLSNPALEQLLVLIRARQNGSITWHVHQGRFEKFRVDLSGSMRNGTDLKRVTALVQP